MLKGRGLTLPQKLGRTGTRLCLMENSLSNRAALFVKAVEEKKWKHKETRQSKTYLAWWFCGRFHQLQLCTFIYDNKIMLSCFPMFFCCNTIFKDEKCYFIRKKRVLESLCQSIINSSEHKAEFIFMLSLFMFLKYSTTVDITINPKY